MVSSAAVILLLKCVSQLILVACGVISLRTDPFEERGGKRHLNKPGKILLSGILLGFVLFVTTESLQHRDNAQSAQQLRDQHADEMNAFKEQSQTLNKQGEGLNESLLLSRSELANQQLREIVVRWERTDTQMKYIRDCFHENIQHAQAANWPLGGLTADRDFETKHWDVNVLGVEERIERWRGSSETSEFNGLKPAMESVILRGLAIKRADSADIPLLSGTANVTGVEIDRDTKWITVWCHGRDLTFDAFASGEIQFVFNWDKQKKEDNDVRWSQTLKQEFLPTHFTLSSRDRRFDMNQDFMLTWHVPSDVTNEDPEIVFKQPETPAVSKKVGLCSMIQIPGHGDE